MSRSVIDDDPVVALQPFIVDAVEAAVAQGLAAVAEDLGQIRDIIAVELGGRCLP
jgi:hypothetical protein